MVGGRGKKKFSHVITLDLNRVQSFLKDIMAFYVVGSNCFFFRIMSVILYRPTMGGAGVLYVLIRCNGG